MTLSYDCLSGHAASDHGVELIHGDRHRALRRAKVHHLFGCGINDARRGGRKRAFHRGAREDVDLVALAGLEQRRVDAVLPFPVPTRAAFPCHGQVAGAVAAALDLDGREAAQAVSLEYEGI